MKKDILFSLAFVCFAAFFVFCSCFPSLVSCHRVTYPTFATFDVPYQRGDITRVLFSIACVVVSG